MFSSGYALVQAALFSVGFSACSFLEIESDLPTILQPDMHLQQTKFESRESGGPQYWLQELPQHISGYLKREKACSVVLMTPYGPVETPFTAVDKDHKLKN